MSGEKKNVDEQVNNIKSQINQHLGDQNFPFKDMRNLIQKLGSFQTWQIIQPLEELIKNEKSSDDIKVHALEELGKYGEPRVIKILAEFVHSDKSSLKNAAVKGLSLIKNQKVIDPLLSVVNDDDKWIRIFAIHGLQKNYNPKVVKPIVQCLGDKESGVRQEAIAALNRIDEDLLADELIEALKSDNRFLRLGAVSIIGDKEISKAADNLIEVLDGDDLRLGLIASRALSKIGDPNTIPKLLIRALKQGDMDGIYAMSIFNMGLDAVRPLISLYAVARDEKIQNVIMEVLKKFGDVVLEEILDAANNAEPGEEKDLLDSLYKKF